MLRIQGGRTRACDGLNRREAMQVGGLSLFPALTLSKILRAEGASGAARGGAARSIILLNLFGGPPHQDLFDLKPLAPAQIRGEFQPIETSVPGVQIGELLPQIAQVMDRCTLIRTYSHSYNSHNPYNVYTGFDGGNDRENYFAKRTDHPSMAAVYQHFRPVSGDVPPYVILPAFPGYSQALRRAGPYGGYLGAEHDPLFTLLKPIQPDKRSDYQPVVPFGTPELPSLESLPSITADRLDRRHSLLEQLEHEFARVERARGIRVLDHFQQQVFSLLTSPKTRAAFDLERESAAVRDRYGRSLWGNSLLICRRLVEAGSLFVSVNWEEGQTANHWDLHENNFGMCRVQAPIVDQIVAALIADLEERGLLEQTLIVVMGEMGRTPRINAKAGRDHWPQCGFVLLAGGGTKRGLVLGKTDAEAAYPIERPVSAGDLVATFYQLLGLDPHLMIEDLTGRPIPISHGGDPVWEVIA
ncbi:MAG: DUF1501 domain-containing protein [Planctomycetales bacterium]